MRQVTRKGLITMAAASGVLALSGGYAHADAGAAAAASNSPGVLSGNSIQVPIDIPVNACGNSANVGGALNPSMGNDCTNTSSGAAHGASADDGAPAGDGSGSSASDGSATHGSASGSNASGTHGSGSQGPGGQGHGSQSPGSQASGHDAWQGGDGTGRHRASGATAEGQATGSPGIGSGNQLQVPVQIPVNLCGNSVTIGGLLNPVFGNDCANDAEPGPAPQTPVTPDEPTRPVTHGPSTPHAPEAQLLPDEQLAHTGAGGLDLLIPAGVGLLFAGAGTVLYRRSRSAA